jgi:hypothetical protein
MRRKWLAVSFFLALFCLLAGDWVPNAAAADAVAATGESGRRFGTVFRLRGEVTASVGESGRERRLREGDVVYVGERVRAAATAEAVIKTDDAGLLAVRPGGVFVIERFAADGKASDNFTVRLITGALRVISGWVGRVNPGEHRIATPSATIGIRGTDHEPYVMTPELAEKLAQKEGTYDKVNRGGTTLDASGNKLDIDPGKVGFVRGQKPFKTRALMTLLLPVLLDKVPEFYVPGQFDAELDRLSKTADDEAMRRLEERRKRPPEAPAAAVEPAATAAASTAAEASADAAKTAPTGTAKAGECSGNQVAKTWLGQLDTAIAKGNAKAILALFVPDVVVRATVRGKDGGMTTLDLGRDEFAQSTIAAVKGLSDYRQRRPSIEGMPVEAGGCERIAVKSLVIEQGKQQGKPYVFESIEEYVLERRAGKWLAIKAETTQR